MVEINWTDEAEIWLKDIHDFIARDNPTVARRIIDGIYKKAQILHQFLEMGYKYRSEPEGDIRILLYGHYRIASLLKGKTAIDILGVFHGALDIDRYLP